MTQTANTQNDFWDFLRILALIAVSLFIAIVMSTFCGCKSTRITEHHNEKVTDTLVHKSENDSTIEHTNVAWQMDSLHHNQSDTIISKHWESNDTTVSSNVERFVNRRDSMAIKVDSVGHPTYYYYTHVHEKEIHHDSIKIRNTIIDSTYQSRSLLDELKNTRIINDSLRLYYTRLDSTYLSLRDSIDNAKEEIVTKQPILRERIRQAISTLLISLGIIALFYLLTKFTLKRY